MYAAPALFYRVTKRPGVLAHTIAPFDQAFESGHALYSKSEICLKATHVVGKTSVYTPCSLWYTVNQPRIHSLCVSCLDDVARVAHTSNLAVPRSQSLRADRSVAASHAKRFALYKRILVHSTRSPAHGTRALGQRECSTRPSRQLLNLPMWSCVSQP